MAGDIFYSQLNSSLRDELLLRSAAGKLVRSEKYMDYMLQKISNVRITSFESSRDSKVIGILGGETVRTNTDGTFKQPYDNGSYLPGGESGYFTNESTRIGPVITGISVTLADSSINNAINAVSATIVVPDPAMIDKVEEIFMRPGRLLEFEIIQPSEAILSDNIYLNQDESLFTTRILQQVYEKNPNFDISQYFEMNKFVFLGLVDGFKIEYQEDASIQVTINSRAAASVFTDVSMFVSNPEIPNISIDEKKTEKFSDLIKNEINSYVESKVEENPDGFIERYSAIKDPISTDDRILLYAPLYKNSDGTKYETTTMISLGLLIDFIEKFLYEPAKKNEQLPSPTEGIPPIPTPDSEKLVVPDLRIQISDEICKTNYYEFLVSADPKRILLYQGQEMESNSNSYIVPKVPSKLNEGYSVTSNGAIVADSIDSIGEVYIAEVPSYTMQYYSDATNIENVPGFYEMSASDNESPALEKYGCLSRILINLNVISEIEDKLRNNENKPFTVKNFLRGINNEINDQTGGAINPGVIFHPELPNILIYYDQNYLGPNKAVSEFEIPAYSSKTEGTVIRDLKLSYDIPEKDRNIIFGFRSSDISTSKMSAYNPYLISQSPDQKIKQENEWMKQHAQSVFVLENAKSDLTTDINDQDLVYKLQDALKGYVKYSKPKLKDSLSTEKPRWLYKLEFTVDGINGFRFGDVFQFRGLPVRNKSSYVFCIDKIVHTVNATGEWTTNISATSRAKSDTLF